ncbi:unnamed protein product [Auanema sp. JU1783]|nr:unnamed protein product [Auanema sp. JU1783]
MLFAWIVLCAFVIQTNCDEAGGYNEEDAEDYMPTAWKAAVHLNQENTSIENYYIPIKVFWARSQVVSGTKHEFEALYGESTCKRTAMEPSEISEENCSLKEGAARAIYNVTLYENPSDGTEKYTVTKVRDVSPDEQL